MPRTLSQSGLRRIGSTELKRSPRAESGHLDQGGNAQLNFSRAFHYALSVSLLDHLDSTLRSLLCSPDSGRKKKRSSERPRFSWLLAADSGVPCHCSEGSEGARGAGRSPAGDRAQQ